jgi:hypothetical protein
VGDRKSVWNTAFYHISKRPPRPSSPSTHNYILLTSTNHSVQSNSCSDNYVILFACDRPIFQVTRTQFTSVPKSAHVVAHPFRCTCTSARVFIIKPTRCTNFSNLFLEWKSTWFRQFLRPSSGFFHSAHSNGIRHTGLLKASEQFRPDPARKLSAHPYDIRNCCVQWKTPDDRQRNCLKHVVLFQKLIWEISASSWFDYKSSWLLLLFPLYVDSVLQKPCDIFKYLVNQSILDHVLYSVPH